MNNSTKIIIAGAYSIILFCGGIFVGYKNFKPIKPDTIIIHDAAPPQSSILIPVDPTDNSDLIKRANAKIGITHTQDGTLVMVVASDTYKSTTAKWIIDYEIDNSCNLLVGDYYLFTKKYGVNYYRLWNNWGVGGGVVIKDKTKFDDIKISGIFKF